MSGTGQMPGKDDVAAGVGATVVDGDRVLSLKRKKDAEAG
jgi:hypothetical protein